MQLIDFLEKFDSFSVQGITADSRQVRKGYLFAALQGSKLRGESFISDAIQNGAQYILVEEGVSVPEEYDSDNVVFIQDKNTRYAFSQIAQKFYNLQPENIVAVTGTSGKTSTVSFVQQLWHLSGIVKCASLGTLGIRGPGMRRGGGLTTLATERLHAEIADLAAAGITHLAMEASSHGVHQYRLDGVGIKVAAYTNLSRDHLDYHKDLDDYFDAKSRLFSEVLKPNSVAVINADDAYAEKLMQICQKAGHKIIDFGQSAETIKLIENNPVSNGQAIKISVEGEVFNVTLPLVGEFQVMNALCALGLVMALGGEVKKYVPLLEELRGVAGRLQYVAGHPNGSVYIDYAHKPAALEAVLNTLRPHTKNNLVCLFGCGGNRDEGKRGLMGKISSDLADVTIVTDDNPRYENPEKIRAQILEAVPNAREIGSRSEAIRYAIQNLGEGDVLVVAGKGHEQGQMVGDEVHPFDDLEEVKKAIGELK